MHGHMFEQCWYQVLNKRLAEPFWQRSTTTLEGLRVQKSWQMWVGAISCFSRGSLRTCLSCSLKLSDLWLVRVAESHWLFRTLYLGHFSEAYSSLASQVYGLSLWQDHLCGTHKKLRLWDNPLRNQFRLTSPGPGTTPGIQATCFVNCRL